MKITREQFEQAVLAAVERSNTGGEALITDAAIAAALTSLGIEVGIAPVVDEMIWVERTWIDVRQGDIVRPVQPPSRRDDETHAAIVEAIGPVNHWHASPNANEYRPNESPLEWSAIRVTLRQLPFMGASPEPFTPEHGMKPDAGVEIKVTRAELAAIEALGGWVYRVGVMDS